LFNWTAGIWTIKEKICGIGNTQSPLNAKVKLLKSEILYLTVHYKNNGDDDNNQTINLSNIPGKHKIQELQKSAVLGTACILQKVLTKNTVLTFTKQEC
jgi:hypothetical protein